MPGILRLIFSNSVVILLLTTSRIKMFPLFIFNSLDTINNFHFKHSFSSIRLDSNQRSLGYEPNEIDHFSTMQFWQELVNLIGKVI
jgi:hypothetical protein